MNNSLLNHLSFLSNFPLLNNVNKAYWIKIRTNQPNCIYYFGPFDNPQEAKLHQNGYIEDLIEEKASGIYIEIKKCKPKTLTVCEEE